MDNQVLKDLETQLGCAFTHDACSDTVGANAHCASFSSPANPFLQTDCSGQTVWLNPPFSRAAQFIQHYLQCKSKAPLSTAACIVVPQVAEWYRPASWTPFLQTMRLVRQFPAGAAILRDSEGRLVRSSLPLNVWYDGPDPQQLPLATQQDSSAASTCPCDAYCSVNAARRPTPGGLSLLFDAHLAGRKGGVVLVDTGASHAFISMAFAKDAGLQLHPSALRSVGMANARTTGVLGCVQLPIRIGRYRASITAHIMDSMLDGVDLILGDAWLRAVNGTIQYPPRNSTPFLRVTTPQGGKVRLRPRTAQRQGATTKVQYGPHENDRLDLLEAHLASALSANTPFDRASGKAMQKLMRKGARAWLVQYTVDEGAWTDNQPAAALNAVHPTGTPPQASYMPSADDVPEGVSAAHLAELAKLVEEYTDVAPPDGKIPDGLPPMRGLEVEAIRLMPGAVVPKPRMRRTTPKELEACREYITDLLKKGWISPAHPEIASPILFVEKPSGGLRVVLDARATNRVCVPIHTRTPEVPELLDKLHGKTIFSTFDLIQGYNQLRLVPSDIPKTGMVTPLGSYVWQVLPMGMRNASAVYQSTMERIFAPLIKKGTVHIMQDDLCCASSSVEEHMADLKEIFAILRQHKLYVNVRKLQLLRSSVKWLGFIVGKDGIAMDPGKISTIKEWPQPTDAHQLRQFLGLANYFRKFIQGMATMAAPLNNLLQKNVACFKDAWTDVHTGAFEALKQALSSPPVLKLPDFERPFTIISDASLLGTGALLMQDAHPVAYTSKKFSPAERNYTTTEQEMLGVVRALTEWRYACEGPETTIQTDHNPLIYLPTQSQPRCRDGALDGLNSCLAST